MAWQLAEKGLGTQNTKPPANRPPQLGDVLEVVPCGSAPAWTKNYLDPNNTTARSPFTLALKDSSELCLDSATLSTQCGWERQCGAVLWNCSTAGASPAAEAAAAVAAHTWSHYPDNTLRNVRDAGFVGSNGGASSGGQYCVSLNPASAAPENSGCPHEPSQTHPKQTWIDHPNGTIESGSTAGMCLGHAPSRTVEGVDQFMVGDGECNHTMSYSCTTL